MVENPPTNAGDAGSLPGSGRSPKGGNGNPLQCSCLENLHGQRSLATYSQTGVHRLGYNLATKQQCYHFLQKESRKSNLPSNRVDRNLLYIVGNQEEFLPNFKSHFIIGKSYTFTVLGLLSNNNLFFLKPKNS